MHHGDVLRSRGDPRDRRHASTTPSPAGTFSPRRRDLRRRQQRLGGRRRRRVRGHRRPARRRRRSSRSSATGRVKAILCTHAHDDHVRVAPALRERVTAPILLHPDDRPLWELTHTDELWDVDLADGQQIEVAGTTLRVLHTPGPRARVRSASTPPDLGCVFTGDTLFQGGPGATGRSFSDRDAGRRVDPRPAARAARRHRRAHRPRRRHHDRRRARERRPEDAARCASHACRRRRCGGVGSATVTATYRLQLHAGFTFADAEAVVPYLADLGVTHLYLSPVLQAVPGSMHGYDVARPRPGQRRARRPGRARSRSPATARAARPRPGRRRGAQPHGAGRAGERQRPAVGRAGPRPRAPRTRTGSTSTGTPSTAGSACRCCGSRSPTCSPRATCGSARRTAGQVLRYHDHVFPVADGTWDGDPRADVAAVLERAALPAGRLARARRGAQLPPVLRRRRADRGPGRGARRLRGHPPGAARPQPPRRHRGLPHRPPRRARRPRGLPRAAARRAPARHRDLGGEDPRGRRAAARAGPATAPPGTTPPRRSPRRSSTRPPPRRCRRLGGRPAASRTSSDVVADVQAPGGRRRARSPSGAGCSAVPPRCCPTPTRARLAEAVVELLVACEVYRAYVRPGRPRPTSSPGSGSRTRRATAPRRPAPT